jgi:hypothetical protein
MPAHLPAQVFSTGGAAAEASRLHVVKHGRRLLLDSWGSLSGSADWVCGNSRVAKQG